MPNFKKNLLNSFIPDDSELYNLSCEYIIMLLDKIEFDYMNVKKTAEKINENIPNLDAELYKECLWFVEALIDYYSKLVKSIKLSIGQNVGNVQSQNKIFEPINYNQNNQLQNRVIHGLRNTSQHFEERLQNFGYQMNPFLSLSYTGHNTDWNIKFGKGGYSHIGHKKTLEKEVFDIDKLFFNSYRRENGNIIPENVSISDIWNDSNEIFKMIKYNMELKRDDNNSQLPGPPRNLSLFEIPFNKEGE